MVLKSLLFASKREREREHLFKRVAMHIRAHVYSLLARERESILFKRVAMHIRAHASVFEPNQVPRNVGLEVVGHGFVLGTLL